MKRVLCLFAVLILCFSVTAGGTSEASGASTMDEAIQSVAVDKEPVEISFWTGTGAQNYPYLEAMVNSFMEEYPNITVDFSNQGALNDLTVKLTQNIVSRSTPTISNIATTTFPEYIASGAIVDLLPYCENETIGYTDEELADFFPNYIAEVKSYEEGTMYGWPTNKKTTDVLIYNKTFFDEHGWTAPSNWDEVAELAKAITEETGIPAFSYDTAYGDAAFKTLSMQWGSPYVTADGTVDVYNEASLEAIDYYKTNMDAGYFTLPSLMPSANGGNYSNVGFKKGECYMFVGSAAGIQYAIPNPEAGDVEFEVSVAPVPQKDSENAVTFSKGENYAVFSNSTEEQRVAAWLLIKYLSAAENNVEWFIKTGNLPISNSQVEEPEYQAFLASEPGSVEYYFALEANAALAMQDIMTFDVAFADSLDFTEEIGTMWKSVMIGGADPEAALMAIDEEF